MSRHCWSCSVKDNLSLPSLDLGIYRHYKGKQYEVVAVAMDEETLQPLVIYKPLYPSSVKLWARAYNVFCEMIVIDGKSIPRFEKI